MKQKQDGRVQRKRECFVLVVSDNDVHDALTRFQLHVPSHSPTSRWKEEGGQHDHVNIDLFLHYLSCYVEFKSLAKCGTWEKCFQQFSDDASAGIVNSVNQCVGKGWEEGREWENV